MQRINIKYNSEIFGFEKIQYHDFGSYLLLTVHTYLTKSETYLKEEIPLDQNFRTVNLIVLADSKTITETEQFQIQNNPDYISETIDLMIEYYTSFFPVTADWVKFKTELTNKIIASGNVNDYWHPDIVLGNNTVNGLEVNEIWNKIGYECGLNNHVQNGDPYIQNFQMQ